MTVIQTSESARERLARFFCFDQKFEAAKLAGVDEVGRGPLAGPVIAAAVVILYPENIECLHDSKKLSEKKRISAYFNILENALVGVGTADEDEIDHYNILQASLLAMKRAVLNLPCTPDHLAVDGNQFMDLPIEQTAVVKGDQKSAAIASASIVAKVVRDHFMSTLDEQYPDYGFSGHKGYPTAEHLKKLKLLGVLPVHRKSFTPVKKAMSGARG